MHSVCLGVCLLVTYFRRLDQIVLKVWGFVTKSYFQFQISLWLKVYPIRLQSYRDPKILGLLQKLNSFVCNKPCLINSFISWNCFSKFNEIAQNNEIAKNNEIAQNVKKSLRNNCTIFLQLETLIVASLKKWLAQFYCRKTYRNYQNQTHNLSHH